MKKTSRHPMRLIAGCIAPCTTVAHAASDSVPSGGQAITRAGTQATIVGAPANFDGRALVDPLTRANEAINAASAYVTFAPGAHSVWHTRPHGAISDRDGRHWPDPGMGC